MNEFTKQKIAFAVAFLAALFSISPMLKDFGAYGFAIFGLYISLNHLYYVVASIFTLAVYAFGIQFITEKGLNWASKVGNALYALAIIVPLVYLCLAILVPLVEVAGKHLGNISVNIITGVVGTIVGALASRVTYKFQNLLAERERNATSEQLDREETLFMRRAQELMRAKQYDLAVVEAFKAIEVSAKKALLEQGMYFQPNKWISEISKNEMLPEELANGLNDIRQIRNTAAHGVEPVTADIAKSVMPIASRIVAKLSSKQDVT